jgi:hypothetical protein
MATKLSGRIAIAWGIGAVGLLIGTAMFAGGVARQPGGGGNPNRDPIRANAELMIDQGQQTFRFDTFGDEAFWGGMLGLHQSVAQLSPTQALGLGLKVDSEALPPSTLNALRHGRLDLSDPAVTLALLRQDAVVGVKGFFTGGSLTSIGITCALCHATVDNSVTAGVGRRLDGWANRDLDVGAIVASAPNLQPIANLLHTTVPAVRRVLLAWGPGKFDAQLLLDGQGFRPDGRTAAVLIPPAFGLAGVNQHTWEGGWGTVTYWNAFVANLAMHGQGTLFDPRLDNAAQFPIAAENGFGHIRSNPDLVSPKLPALHFYQLAIPAPPPPPGSFNAAAAARGEVVFEGVARCTNCHVEPTYSEPGWNSHAPEEIGVDAFQANRGPDGRYRTSPLRGLWTHQRGGFFHDGRFATLLDVVNHYDQFFNLHLTPQQKNDLVEYLKSL